MVEVWKAIGMDLDYVEFVWLSEEINKKVDEYWLLVLDIVCKNKFVWILRCL